MADTEEGADDAPWLAGPVMSRPRDQYISSMFSRNLLTRQISMRKSAYRPRYAEWAPLTPPDTPTTARTGPSSVAEETGSPPPPSPRRPGPAASSSSPPSASSPYAMLLDETTLDRPSIRLYLPDAVPEAVVAAAAAATATANGGLEARAWRLVLVSGGALARLKTALAGGAAYATGVSSSWPGSLAFFGAPLAAVVCGARASNSSSLRGGRRHAVAVGAALHGFRLALAARGLGSCLLHASVARWPLDAVRRALAGAPPQSPGRAYRPQCRPRHRHYLDEEEDGGTYVYGDVDDDGEDGDDDGDGGYGHHPLHDHRCAANMQILCALAIGYEDTDFLVGSVPSVARGATVGRSMVWVRD